MRKSDEITIKVKTKSDKVVVLVGMTDEELDKFKNEIQHPTYTIADRQFPKFGIIGIVEDNNISRHDIQYLNDCGISILPRLATDRNGHVVPTDSSLRILQRYISRLRGNHTLILYLTKDEVTVINKISFMLYHLDI